MTLQGVLQIVLYVAVLLLAAKPLGLTWPGCTQGNRPGWDGCSGRWSG